MLYFISEQNFRKISENIYTYYIFIDWSQFPSTFLLSHADRPTMERAICRGFGGSLVTKTDWDIAKSQNSFGVGRRDQCKNLTTHFPGTRILTLNFLWRDTTILLHYRRPLPKFWTIILLILIDWHDCSWSVRGSSACLGQIWWNRREWLFARRTCSNFFGWLTSRCSPRERMGNYNRIITPSQPQNLPLNHCSTRTRSW